MLSQEYVSQVHKGLLCLSTYEYELKVLSQTTLADLYVSYFHCSLLTTPGLTSVFNDLQLEVKILWKVYDVESVGVGTSLFHSRKKGSSCSTHRSASFISNFPPEMNTDFFSGSSRNGEHNNRSGQWYDIYLQEKRSAQSQTICIFY